jgi:hypothetical protein
VNNFQEQVLPQLLDVIRELSSRGVVAVLTCLQFVYWSIVQLDISSQGQQVREYKMFSACFI